MNPLDIVQFAASLPAKIDKDERRIKLFAAASLKKGQELVASGNPIAVADYAKDQGELLWLYVKASNPKKLSLGNLFGADPFKNAREETRKFSRKWGLDPKFVEEMG